MTLKRFLWRCWWGPIAFVLGMMDGLREDDSLTRRRRSDID